MSAKFVGPRTTDACRWKTNTRVVVFGHDGTQARAAAEAITGEAFHNVAFYGGTFESLRQRVK